MASSQKRAASSEQPAVAVMQERPDAFASGRLPMRRIVQSARFQSVLDAPDIPVPLALPVVPNVPDDPAELPPAAPLNGSDPPTCWPKDAPSPRVPDPPYAPADPLAKP